MKHTLAMAEIKRLRGIVERRNNRIGWYRDTRRDEQKLRGELRKELARLRQKHASTIKLIQLLREILQ